MIFSSDSQRLLIRRTDTFLSRRYASFFSAFFRLSLPHLSVESISMQRPSTIKSKTYGPKGTWNSAITPCRLKSSINADSCGSGYFLKLSARAIDIRSRISGSLDGLFSRIRKLFALAQDETNRVFPANGWRWWADLFFAASDMLKRVMPRFLAAAYMTGRLMPARFAIQRIERFSAICMRWIISSKGIENAASSLSIGSILQPFILQESKCLT